MVLVVGGRRVNANRFDAGIGDADNERIFDQLLPAVIPISRPPTAVPIWGLARPHWRLVVVAVLSWGVGILTAMLWPVHNDFAAIADQSPSGHKSASPAVGDAARPSTKITMAVMPSVGIAKDACRVSFPAPQLVVHGPPTVLPAGTVASLGLAVDGASDGAQVVICGFAAKSVFSAGQSIDEKTWTMAISDAADATLIPPQGFAGPMKLVVALLKADTSLADRRMLHLQWLPPAPGAPAMLQVAEVNERLEEGKRLRAMGNLPLARGIFLRYAQAGDARAAFLLAESYDPISLAKRQLLPPESDPELARIWYRKALDFGAQEAISRLERLSNW
jgi:hypothetical protein